ncbi:MAG: MarR family transcriptional regulator [Gemmatimonadaceae bacterium]
MMEAKSTRQRPIGYWLRRADELLTAKIDDAQREQGLTRLDWQTLSLLHDARTTPRDALVESLSPFADAPSVIDGLASLADRGLLRLSAGDEVELTPDGSAIYAKALAVQEVVRKQAAAGIDEAEYTTTVSVLRRLVDNLGE